MKISLEVTSGGFVTEREPFIFSVAVSDQIEAKPYFLPYCVCWEGGRGAAGVRSSSFRGQRTALWDRDRNTDEITGKAPSYCFRTSYILPAFRSQVLPVTELIFLTSDMVSSIRKTNKRVDHKGPELTGVVMFWFAGQTVLSLSQCCHYLPWRGNGRSAVVCFPMQTCPRWSSISWDLWSWDFASWLLLFVPRLSRRNSGGTGGRTGVTGCLLLGPCLFSLGLVHIDVFMECFDHWQIVCQQCATREFANWSEEWVN